MHPKFFGLRPFLLYAVTIAALAAPPLVAATPEQLMALPLIVPEPVFNSLGRVTSDLRNQRIMDRGSILRISFPDGQQSLPADMGVVFFRQGLRLTDGERKLGILAIPIGYGQALTRTAESQEVADPVSPGVGWVRLERTRQEVTRGDSIMTRAQAERWTEKTCLPNPNPNDAADPQGNNAIPATSFNVIALADSKASAGLISTTQDLVVISGGCKTGLNTGQSLSLWRPTIRAHGRKLDEAVEDRDNDSTSVLDDNPGITRTLAPGHRIGNGVVVAVYEHAAIVRIRVATQPVQIGDQVRPTHARKQP